MPTVLALDFEEDRSQKHALLMPNLPRPAFTESSNVVIALRATDCSIHWLLSPNILSGGIWVLVVVFDPFL
jgi:hypothetical protein